MDNDNGHNSSHPGAEQEDGQVQVLPPEEREKFKGITIDVGEEKQDHRNYSEYEYRDPHKRVYVRRVKLPGGFLNWLPLGLLIIAVTLMALPFLFFIILPMIIIILLSSLFRR